MTDTPLTAEAVAEMRARLERYKDGETRDVRKRESERLWNYVITYLPALLALAERSLAPPEEKRCVHWPGQKRCDWCDLGKEAAPSSNAEVARDLVAKWWKQCRMTADLTSLRNAITAALDAKDRAKESQANPDDEASDHGQIEPAVESGSRLAAGRTAAATSEIMDATSRERPAPNLDTVFDTFAIHRYGEDASFLSSNDKFALGKVWTLLTGQPFPVSAKDREPEWKPTHRHLKTGALYRVICPKALLERSLEASVVYDDPNGTVWVRPYDEFHDGRFEPVTKDREPASFETMMERRQSRQRQRMPDLAPVAQPAERTVKDIVREGVSDLFYPGSQWRSAMDRMLEKLRAERERTKAAESRCAELEAALQPFAESGDDIPAIDSDAGLITEYCGLTIGELRQASKALSSGTPHLDKLLADARREAITALFPPAQNAKDVPSPQEG